MSRWIDESPLAAMSDRRARLANEARVEIYLDCYCRTCKLWHRPGPRTPDEFSRELWEWHAKHVGHDFEFLSPKRRIMRFRDKLWQKLGFAPWWLDFGANTNFKLAYSTATAFTISLNALGSSSTWIAGRDAVAIDNTSSRNIDSEITARILTGTTPTVDSEIRVYGVQALFPDTTVVWPDTILGTNAAVSLTSAYMRDGGIKPLLGATAISATTGLTYPIACLSTAQAWGKEPKRWTVFVTHNNTSALGTQVAPTMTYTSSYLTDT
jgi:hypothetical protein